jgi:trimeric autotransporter adhesin
MNNVAVGFSAGVNVSTGLNNTCIGTSAGDTITTGTSNIIIGYVSDVSAADGDSQFVLGNGVTCVGNNNFTFGDGTSDSNIANGATTITAPSDIRLKEDIQDEEVGLDFINDLRPVTFLWKEEK